MTHNRRVRVYERLVRRILDMPRAPAVVLVQVGRVCWALQLCELWSRRCADAAWVSASFKLPPSHTLPQVGNHGLWSRKGDVAANGKAEWRPFHHTAEDLYGSVARYYAASTLSLRRVAH